QRGDHRRRVRGRRPHPALAVHDPWARLDRARRVYRGHAVRAGGVRLHQGAVHGRASAAERGPDGDHRRARRRGGVSHRVVHHVITRIAFLVFPRLTLLDFVGGYDALRRVAALGVDPTVKHRIIGTAPEIADENGLMMKPDSVYEDLRDFDLLYVPGGFGTRQLVDDERCIAYLRSWGTTRPLASVCTGSLLLGRAGYLTGKRATTNHAALDLLRPYCADVVTDRRIVDEGLVVTAGGVSSSLDLGLYLVEKFWGQPAREKIAAKMEYRGYSAVRSDARGVAVLVGRQHREDAGQQLLVVRDVVREDRELAGVGQVHRSQAFAARRAEDDGLKARPPLLGMVGDHDRAQRGPVLAREHEDRGVPPLVLERDELLDEGPVGHLDEELALVAVVGRQGGVERRRPIVADEAEAGLVLEGADAVPRAAEDGLHQGDGNAVLRVVKVHGPRPNVSKTWAKSACRCR